MTEMTEKGELTIGLFGRSGSGKTTFLASYAGKAGSSKFSREHGYKVSIADDASGARLISNFSRIEHGKYPEGTDLADSYRFHFKVKDITRFAPMDITFYDYPGGWWDATDDADKDTRYKFFQKMLECQVGILVFDSQKFLEDGVVYIVDTLRQFKKVIENVKSDADSKGLPLNFGDKTIRNWLLVFTKADCLPEDLRKARYIHDILMNDDGIKEELEHLKEELMIKSLGENLLLVAAAPAKRTKSDDYSIPDINSEESCGLECIAPLCFRIVLDDILRASEKAHTEAAKRAEEESFLEKMWGSISRISDAGSNLMEMVVFLADSVLEKYIGPQAAILKKALPFVKTINGISDDKYKELTSQRYSELNATEREQLAAKTLELSFNQVIDNSRKKSVFFRC